MNAEPRIIWEARTRKGHKNYADLARKIKYEALDVALTRQGLPKEMTKERRFGYQISQDRLDPDNYRRGYREELIRIIDNYCKEDPDVFVNNLAARDTLLAEMEESKIILKEKPAILNAMFTRVNQEIPAEIRPEKTRQSSTVHRAREERHSDL